MSSTTQFNRLENEKSAYLKQHRTNPVAWMPYGNEALQKAKEENKPLLISIGYSSCHWCHVMAEESFEDETTAKYLNDNFICVKVDKEEMPDLDQYCQMVCQLMNGRGGWPLNVFFTADMKPFYAGTYFPKTGNQNMPGFMDVLQGLNEAYANDKETIHSNASQLIEATKAKPKAKENPQYQGHFPNAASIINAVKPMADEKNGGYGKAPKFAQFSFFEFAVEQILEGMVPEELAKHIIMSLEKILMGGVYDHARGGIHRYAVDEAWLIPHFEKMLYDQAGLLRVLSRLSLIYPSPLILDALVQTLTYIQKEMLSDSGYFFAAQDADSEGVEGLYFTFTKDEFVDALTREDEEAGARIDEILSWFKFTDEGNFEKGLNVVALNPEKRDEYFKPENWNLVRKIRATLLEERKQRIPPMTDSKGVASWNFMMISSLVDVVQYSKIQNSRDLASELLKKSVEGLHKTFLIHGEEADRSGIKGSTTKEEPSELFEDFVTFAHCQLRLYEVSGNETFLQNGLETLAHIKEAFWKEDCFYTRSLEGSPRAYENIPAPVFDQSYQAPVGTYLFLLRKWSLHSETLRGIWAQLDKTVEELKNVSLTNPLGFGEMMRAMVYPDDAFKIIKIPMAWLHNNKIQALFPNLSSRFALTYSQDQDEKWEICNQRACELQGEGFESFKNVFFPPNPQKQTEH